MASVKFPRKEFEKHINLTKDIEEQISLFGTHLESLNEKEIELEILPNRPDLLSMQGFLRAFRSYLNKEPGLKQYKINKPEKDYKVRIDSSVKDIRPYTACAIVKNLEFNDEKIKEIIDLQEKLHATIGRNRKKVAIGIYPLEKIKLPIKYQALSPDKIKFTPLESDKEMTAQQILKRHPTGKEYAHLIENLDKYPLFTDSDNKVLSMPPIINSHEIGKVTNETKEIFIECSGSDFQTLKKTLNIIVTTLADLGGKIYSLELEYSKSKEITPNFAPEKRKISLENANKLLGLNLKEKDLEKLLPRMGYNYKNGRVEIPAWRTDILHEVDIIEDIAIAYGYNSFIPQISQVATIGSESLKSRIKTKLSEILIGLGLIETSAYHLIKKEEIEKSGNSHDFIELENSKTEYKFLRPNLLIPALRILSENKDADYPQKLFEIGTVFSQDKQDKTETGIQETENLIIIVSPANFTEMKQILNHLTKMLNLPYILKEAINKDLIEGRTAQILINNKPIGYLGDLYPKTLNAWGIKMPVAVIEISLEEIFTLLQQN